MTPEQEIENAIATSIRDTLEQNEIEDIQVTGLLSITQDAKAMEDADKAGYIFVKASPRQYGTPTTPECQISARVVAQLRADVDWNGSTYLEVFNALIGLFENWQRCLTDAHELFSFDNFRMTGYLLNGGDTSLDAGRKTWTYAHDMTVYGICLVSNSNDTNDNGSDEPTVQTNQLMNQPMIN